MLKKKLFIINYVFIGRENKYKCRLDHNFFLGTLYVKYSVFVIQLKYVKKSHTFLELLRLFLFGKTHLRRLRASSTNSTLEPYKHIHIYYMYYLIIYVWVIFYLVFHENYSMNSGLANIIYNNCYRYLRHIYPLIIVCFYFFNYDNLVCMLFSKDSYQSNYKTVSKTCHSDFGMLVSETLLINFLSLIF